LDEMEMGLLRGWIHALRLLCRAACGAEDKRRDVGLELHGMSERLL
jgi:hypothetical protein